MNGDELGRGIAVIAQWYEPAGPPDPATLDRRVPSPGQLPHDRHGSRGRPARVAMVATAAALAVGGIVGATLALRSDGRVVRSTPPAPSDMAPTPPVLTPTPTDSSPITATDRPDDSVENTVSQDTAPGTVASPLTYATSWRTVAVSPLSPRNGAIGVWTGREVLVFGGTEVPLCAVCDYLAPPPPILDGAAYDPSTDTWRAIAPPPAAVAIYATALAIGESVYVAGPAGTEGIELWEYSLTADAWSRVDVPEDASAMFPVAGPDGRLVFAPTGITTAGEPDLLYDPPTDTWTALPDSPFGLGWFDRSYLTVDGRLVLFAKRPLAEVAPDEPSVVSAAVLDEATGTWQLLPDAQQLNAPVFAEGTTAINPDGGGADGGQVNGWGRVVPFGGELHLDDATWHPFPVDEVGVTWGGGVAGTTRAVYRGVQGEVYDLVAERWLSLPMVPNGLGNDSQMTVVAAGLDVFVFGGFNTTAEGMTVTAAAYLLDATRAG